MALQTVLMRRSCHYMLNKNAFQYDGYWSLQWPPLDVTTRRVSMSILPLPLVGRHLLVGRPPSRQTPLVVRSRPTTPLPLRSDKCFWKHYLPLQSVKWCAALPWGVHKRVVHLCTPLTCTETWDVQECYTGNACACLLHLISKKMRMSRSHDCSKLVKYSIFRGEWLNILENHVVWHYL